MGVRERILTIRLLDKVADHPLYAAALGIAWVQNIMASDALADPSECRKMLL